MQHEPQLLELAKRINPLAAKDYAKAKGWVAIETRRPMYILNHPKYHLRQIQIPLELDAPDFGEAMLDLVLRLQSIENRSLDQILQDLIEPDFDILRNSKEEETRSLLIGTVEELKGDLDRDGHR